MSTRKVLPTESLCGLVAGNANGLSILSQGKRKWSIHPVTGKVCKIPNIDGLVKSPIYFVVGLARRFAVPYVLPNRRAKHYVSYIEPFPEPIRMAKPTFCEIIKYYIIDSESGDGAGMAAIARVNAAYISRL